MLLSCRVPHLFVCCWRKRRKGGKNRTDNRQPATDNCLSQPPLRSPLPPAIIRPQRLDHVLHLRFKLPRILLPTRKIPRQPRQHRLGLVWVIPFRVSNNQRAANTASRSQHRTPAQRIPVQVQRNHRQHLPLALFHQFAFFGGCPILSLPLGKGGIQLPQFVIPSGNAHNDERSSRGI